MEMMGNPSAQELAEILVTVGLAQNFAALRALAIEGINKGHMVLHARTTAQNAGVPKHLIEEACQYMARKKKYDVYTVN
jgi:hydroxymethylglutaryl-CoA synthase